MLRFAQRYQNVSLEKMTAYADDAVRILRARARPGQTITSSALAMAGRARMLRGEPEEAAPLFDEAIRELLAERPPQPTWLAQARINWCESLVASNRPEETLAAYRESARDAVASLGPNDPTTLQSGVASALHANAHRAEARQLHEDLLKRVLAVKGEDTLYTPIVRSAYARSLGAEGGLSRHST
jgi:hypothetical protein